MPRITATEAARTLSELLDRAYYRGEGFELELDGRVVARIVPATPPLRISELVRLLAKRSGDAQFADDLECVQADANEPVTFEESGER